MSYENNKRMTLEDGREILKAINSRPQRNMVVGNAEYLLSDRGETDNEPYVFRKTGGDAKAYNREMLKKVVGGTVAWNQLVQNGNFADTSNWTVTSGGSISCSNNVCTYTIDAKKNAARLQQNIKTISGHKYFTSRKIKNNTSGIIRFALMTNVETLYGNKSIESGSTRTLEEIVSAVNNGSTMYFYNRTDEDNVQVNETFELSNFMIFDLTQMFGSTIADAIYAMEQATAGSGVAWFRSLFPNSYYAYDSGSLQSVQAKSHITRGLNQWDEITEIGSINAETGENFESLTNIRSKNYIHLIPGATYYYKSTETVGARYYDAAKNYIGYETLVANRTFTVPSRASYLRFVVLASYGTTYKHDICINISDPAKNGTYEPYAGHTYPLDSDLVLRGIPKWDSTNSKLYYDGDVYEANGKVTRKYGIVDLGSLTWSYDTSGTYPHMLTTGALSGAKAPAYNSVKPTLLCEKYITTDANSPYLGTVAVCITMPVDGHVYVYDANYTDVDTFKTAMSGVYLVYELATPTTETADPYNSVQICNKYGTEEYIDAGVTASTPTRDVSIPVGHETFYPVNVFDYIDEQIAELQALVLDS